MSNLPAEQMTARRANVATLLAMQHDERMAAIAGRAASREPSVSAGIETTAKGEPKPDVKVDAPMGCDYEALREHMRQVVDIEVEGYGRAVSALAKIAAEFPSVV